MSDSPALPVASTPHAATSIDARGATATAGGKDTVIDAMRGFAALLVAYFHGRQVAWVGMQRFHHVVGMSFDPSVIVGYLTLPIVWGSIGVPIFFVISGYCIHRNGALRLAHDANFRLDARLFWARRFARIYPVLFGALLLTLVLDSVSLHLPPVSHKIREIGWHAFLVNLFSLQGVAGYTYGSNGALWTLSLEVQFYAVYPLLFAVRKRFGMHAVLAGITVINVVSAFVLERHDIQFFTSYWLSWTIGAYIAELRADPASFELDARRMRTWRIAAALLIALGCAAFARSQYGQYAAFQLWALGFTCYLRTALPYEQKEREAHAHHHTATRLLARCGAFSYSLYLIHLPLFVCLQSLFFRTTLQVSIWPSLAFMSGAVVAAYLFYRCVELPAMRWSASMKARRPAVTRAAA
ncbi:acyltransferase family protein [Trinickia fusca]|uniref:Acyltransferase n=1 Tax=Trinickia fusca TaxID=2419777 RepID=A0A494XE50_9BURK|nr:acyltransferase [Trinickia fusca]RKP46419.1 acyltransferase [Trinickia fusca]